MPPVRVFTVTILTPMAPFAFAAHHIVLDKDEVAFLKTLAPRELSPCPFDDTDVFVSHDDRGFRWRLFVKLHIRAADPRNFHLHQRAIFISALSSGMSGIGNSRISVWLGPVLTAAKTFSNLFSCA